MAVISIALLAGDASKHFAETGFITYFSFYQLLLAAGLSREIFVIRKSGAKAKARKKPYAIWLIMAIGFLFMSIDEIITIHEHMDPFIHSVFKIRETGLTDRIDDILVGCYGLLGLTGFYIYRKEFKKYKEAFPLFAAGFILMFTMVVLDVLTNRDDILRLFLSNASFRESLHYWLKIIEDIFKIVAEGIFVGAFYRCYVITRKACSDVP